MFTWKKLGQLFDPAIHTDIPWMHSFAQSPSVLIFESFVRIYFCTRPPVDEKGQYVSRVGYIDVDRNDLFRIINISEHPVIDLGDVGTFDEFGTNPFSVIRNGLDVRAYYAGWTRCESVPYNTAIGVAISENDGDSFEKIGSGPVIPFTPNEPFVMGSPKIRKFGDTWYLHYSAGKMWLRTEGKPEPVFKIRMATSHNGIDWIKSGRDLISNFVGENECQAGADIFKYEGKYHMFFSYRYPVDFKNKKRGFRLGHAVSKDLHNWERMNLGAGLGVSEEGWDSEMVSYAHVFSLDDKVYMLYQGNGIGQTGFGLAQMESYAEDAV